MNLQLTVLTTLNMKRIIYVPFDCIPNINTDLLVVLLNGLYKNNRCRRA